MHLQFEFGCHFIASGAGQIENSRSQLSQAIFMFEQQRILDKPIKQKWKANICQLVSMIALLKIGDDGSDRLMQLNLLLVWTISYFQKCYFHVRNLDPVRARRCRTIDSFIDEEIPAIFRFRTKDQLRQLVEYTAAVVLSL